MGAGPELRDWLADERGLQLRHPKRQFPALLGRIEQPLAAVARPLPLLDIALIDELLEHPAERLLGDLENVQEVGDLHAGIAVDEMEHPVMGAAEAKTREHVIGIAHEIAIGEE